MQLFLYSRIHTGLSFLQMTVFLLFRSDGYHLVLWLKLQANGALIWKYCFYRTNPATQQFGYVWASMHLSKLNYWSSNAGKKILPLFFKLKKKPPEWDSLYSKCYYYHIFLVHTLKENQKYDWELHLEDQYFSVYGCMRIPNRVFE